MFSDYGPNYWPYDYSNTWGDVPSDFGKLKSIIGIRAVAFSSPDHLRQHVSRGSKGGMKVGEVKEISPNVIESTIGIL